MIKRITLSEPGPLGMKIEQNNAKGKLMVTKVVKDSQACRVGIQPNDILCEDGGIEMALSTYFVVSKKRPLDFIIKRKQNKMPLPTENANIQKTGNVVGIGRQWIFD